jgi:CheY-like chemotaxis protein
MLLQSLRFDSLSATNVNDAMQIISKQKPDLILADYHLPGMDGLEFNRMLKADENYKNIAFILISSSVPVADISKITESSAIDEFIHRPIEPHLFINIINKVWNRRYSQP